MKLFEITIILFMVALVSPASAQQSQPNILFIVVDDQGYADLSAFPHAAKDIQTPNMDRIAKSGVLFERAYVTAPVCSPSRAGMFTGLYQQRWDKKASWNPGLPDNIKSIAEYFKAGNYKTALIGKNDMGKGYQKLDTREHPLKHGYDYFLGFSAHAHDYWHMNDEVEKATPDPNNSSAHLGKLIFNNGYKSIPKGQYITDVFTDEAVNYLSEQKDADNPFLLTLSYNAVHHLIHEVPQKYLDKYGVKPIPKYDPSKEKYNNYYHRYSNYGEIPPNDMRKFYLANLNCLDDNLGRVLDALDANQLTENTIVIYISDNGGSPLTGASNEPLSGHKYITREGGIRVPMMVSYPSKYRKNTICRDNVSALDLLPTVLEASQINLPQSLDGISLNAYLEGKSESVTRSDPIFVLFQDQFVVIKDEWKYFSSKEIGKIWYGGRKLTWPGEIQEQPILVNLDSDTKEIMDYSNEEPERALRMQEAYDNWLMTIQANLGDN